MNVLLVVSHPDDECFCLGTLCLLADRGAKIKVLFVTSGEGDRRVDEYLQPGETRVDAREREAIEASDHWPVEEIIFMRLRDIKEGGQEEIMQGIMEALEDLLALDRVDILITHGSDGEYGHPCHIAVNKSVKKIVNYKYDHVNIMTFNALDIGNKTRNQINLSDPAGVVVNVEKYKSNRRAVLDSYKSQKEAFRPYIVNDDVDKDLDAYLCLRNKETFRLYISSSNPLDLKKLFGAGCCGVMRIYLNNILSLFSRFSELPIKLLSIAARALAKVTYL